MCRRENQPCMNCQWSSTRLYGVGYVVKSSNWCRCFWSKALVNKDTCESCVSVNGFSFRLAWMESVSNFGAKHAHATAIPNVMPFSSQVTPPWKAVGVLGSMGWVLGHWVEVLFFTQQSTETEMAWKPSYQRKSQQLNMQLAVPRRMRFRQPRTERWQLWFSTRSIWSCLLIQH